MNATNRKEVSAKLATLNEEAWLVAFLQAKTTRDLVENPPKDSESLDKIGIGPNNLKRFLIPTFNDFFRRPKSRKALNEKDVMVSTSYKALKELLL